MFKATKPFKDNITGYENEPSLRIGNKVPDNAVNLAYYYNPTATDAEKILASDPPRNTIDHRIETQWLTKVDVASGPNGEEPSIDLFPKSIYYSDEEGYYGRLMRQDDTVHWYPERHVNQKEVSYDNVQIVTKKGDEDKFTEYSDSNGYKGNLYLDTVTYEAYTTKDASVTEQLDYSINNFELNFHDIFGTYLSSEDLNNGPWSNIPDVANGEDYCWPAKIDVTATKLKCSDSGMPVNNTNNTIANYINNLDNEWEGVNEQYGNSNILTTSKPIGYLEFDKIEYQPVAYVNDPIEIQAHKQPPQAVNISNMMTDKFNWRTWVSEDQREYDNAPYLPRWEDKATVKGIHMKQAYLADAGKNYDDILEFISILSNLDSTGYKIIIDSLNDAIQKRYDIAIWLSDCSFIVDDESIDMLVDGDIIPGKKENEIDTIADPSSCHFKLNYKYLITDRGGAESLKLLYNIVACYHSVTIPDTGKCSVQRSITTRKTEAASYRAYCHYSGLVNKNWVDYDGIAFYMGSVTKGNSVGNQTVSEDNELLMFPDETGYLRQIVERINTSTDENNRQVYDVEYKNYYKIEADSIYLTDVFKDNIACFYKYRLKYPIYDYRGPDENGFYNGDALQVVTSMLKDIPDGYKHNIKLSVAKREEIKTYDKYNTVTTTMVPKCYFAELYTSFISSSTDTFKVIYNGFNNIEDDNKIIENGIEEEIYNFPYMLNGTDYQLETVDKKARTSKIRIINYEPLKDERLRITFTWKVVAIDKNTNKIFESEERQSSILNKDYCIPCEYKDFVDRAMIISPKLNGDIYPCSPYDLCINDQAGYQSLDDDYEPVINEGDTNFVYEVKIMDISKPGTVNAYCNPDGSGYILAETTMDTGFYNDNTATYNKKLNLDNPYWTDGKYIYKGYKVKCIDSRTIKVKAPREEKLLDSWYPLIQFGHYSRIMDQYGSSTKVCYSMPEYDTQHYSNIHGQPYVDVFKEKATILNSHMIKTKCYPLLVIEPSINKNTYIYNNKIYRVFKQNDKTWEEAEVICKKYGGHLVMPKTQEELSNVIALMKKYDFSNTWIGSRYENNKWQWLDNSNIEYDNFSDIQSTITENTYMLLQSIDNKFIGSFNDNNVKGFICELTGVISVYKRIDNELFKLTIDNISFSDGVILIKEAISENDDIVVDYSYLEENYNYRGYWRSEDDFVRIDLNPNIYHTYNNPNYLPSEVSPSKNLFNKVIYFFMRPSAIYNLKEENGVFYGVDVQKETREEIVDVTVEYDVYQYPTTVQENKNISSLVAKNLEYMGTNSIKLDTGYSLGKKEILNFIPKTDYNGSFNVTMNTGHWYGFDVFEKQGEEYVLIYTCARSSTEATSIMASHATHNDNASLTQGISNLLLLKNTEYSIVSYECSGGGTEKEKFEYTFTTDHDFGIITLKREWVETEDPNYNDETVFKETRTKTIHEKYVVEEEDEIKEEQNITLYHKIDDPEPDDDADIMLGSVYIRQNTSLHSTILTDSRTRGGGILEGISDSLRKELEPESDFYLDIGYYDGEPYQENGVIIVRLDNRLLKEYGGRFTVSDVEQKVKRWLGAGIYPIVEFVDSYKKEDLPQYNLKVEDSYTNVIDIIPEIFLECVAE